MVNTIQKNILLWFLVNNVFVNFFWIYIKGTFAAIKVNANKLHTLKIPIIIYSWNIAEALFLLMDNNNAWLTNCVSDNSIFANILLSLLHSTNLNKIFYLQIWLLHPRNLSMHEIDHKKLKAKCKYKVLLCLIQL